MANMIEVVSVSNSNSSAHYIPLRAAWWVVNSKLIYGMNVSLSLIYMLSDQHILRSLTSYFSFLTASPMIHLCTCHATVTVTVTITVIATMIGDINKLYPLHLRMGLLVF